MDTSVAPENDAVIPNLDRGEANPSRDRGEGSPSRDRGEGSPSRDRGKANPSRDRGKANPSRDRKGAVASQGSCSVGAPPPTRRRKGAFRRSTARAEPGRYGSLRLQLSRRISKFRITVVILPVALLIAFLPAGCDRNSAEVSTKESPVVYDTTAAKPIEPHGVREHLALQRGPDLKLIDRLMDAQTALPAFERRPLPERPRLIAEGVPLLDDVDPFPNPTPLPAKDVTIRVGLGRSTYRTRTRAEVLSAVQPFIDIVQRQVNVRGAPDLFEGGDALYYALLDGHDQMVIAHVFDYLLIRSWFANQPDNGTVILASARPANPHRGDLDRDFPGIPGAGIELIVARDAEYRSFEDLRGKRLALAANYVHGPGTFLTQELTAISQPRDQRFFSRVTLRRYSKDAVIDVIKGTADAACVDQGTIGALDRFYGLASRVRTLAVSPRYNVDVLFTSLNNIATHRTEIELTQTQLTTLGKDPEGQEVLFFFDIDRWVNYREDDLSVPEQYFKDYLSFIDDTPVDLKPMLDPNAPVDRRTYDRFGDE